MFAIISIGGKQYKVFPGSTIKVERMVADVDDVITLDKVFLLFNGDNSTIGDPILSDVSIKARVLAHTLGEKVVIFKKRRRKNSRTKNGYRHKFTLLSITEISS
jgi:large subunit ribosomal protein L21